ncbi:MAG TPA: EamA family transporter [Ferruginibacter sp.]|nr:EamA family transporter [Ferruginibacter sp.]HMP19770.1 EamA family transporter [Ferruginibacter sp.]
MSNNSRAGGYIALATTSIVWGTTWVSSKVGVMYMPAFQMAAIRQCTAGACIVLFFVLFKKLPLPTARQFGLLAIIGLLMFVGNNGLSTWSLKYIPTGLSALIGALYPLVVVLIELFLFKEKNTSLLTFAGLVLGICGVFIVFYENAFHGARPPGFFLGVVLALIAMLSWSAGTLVIARNKSNIDPYYALGWQMLIGSVVLYAIAAGSGEVVTVSKIPYQAWLAIGYLVVAGSLITFAAFVYSMKKLPAALFSLYAYFNPLVAMVTAAILLHEKLNSNILWGALVTLLGVFLVNYSIYRNRLFIKPG